jgi:hypothetical protein
MSYIAWAKRTRASNTKRIALGVAQVMESALERSLNEMLEAQTALA